MQSSAPRTLLVVNFRPGFAASFTQRSHYRQIVMPPLAHADAHQLLRERFGDDPSLAAAEPEYH